MDSKNINYDYQFLADDELLIFYSFDYYDPPQTQSLYCESLPEYWGFIWYSPDVELLKDYPENKILDYIKQHYIENN